MNSVTPQEVLAFWLDEVGPKGWYAGGEELDQKVRDRFRTAWDEAVDGAYGLWLTYPSGTLAYIILTDQFPRNMFREDPRAFQLDPNARAAAKVAIGRDWDMKIDGEPRQFFYLPLMHSENQVDQDRAVRLFQAKLPESKDNLLHAKAHREIIRRYGRFPYRNNALSRTSSPAEKSFMEDGGYRVLVEEMKASS
ncbi:DUF924 family protein [Pelagovum pacificum]|uniref:DUF924 domain-containing protein n=1 Tax=Pelagovum pacificum TaxID=2588711 RepID=A0A5C5GAH8_9RHOB|nr:DUF924 family protein [Pelagovum pacificum]QQA41395.1 DUF924 domain-containing protein [Pelagovum pacificum]TNY31802.1 DUF924 domain-containing protein [Pelagovum pacificum]